MHQLQAALSMQITEVASQSAHPPPHTSPKFIPPFKRREGLASLLEQEGLKVGLEIGVQQGVFTAALLDKWVSVERYYCLDAWAHQSNYVDIANHPQDTQDRFFNETRTRLRRFGDKVTFVRQFSNTAVHQFQDESLDFVYIDARHDFEGVSEDIRLYWPKLKTGGIFAGHDYLDAQELKEPARQRWGKQDWAVNPDGTRRSDNKAVRSAVNEFAVKQRRQVVVTYEDGYFPTWVMRK
eukprot:NODE_3517_length_953_cov_19.216707_g3365_i0.p1 GENE.NODE_3517_length_953_cov_19.216707_g3365_i0~~NODE_3517_length_953_cov_19.216707_g3365_i0.p1  ORF type:complete len:276 (-),score=69.48 NODE_3517_length_953_cov_19.216707_g3365_i0:126-839(-)